MEDKRKHVRNVMGAIEETLREGYIQERSDAAAVTRHHLIRVLWQGSRVLAAMREGGEWQFGFGCFEQERRDAHEAVICLKKLWEQEMDRR